ncbi:TonB family protein [Fodinibius sp.]|uniref:TonB family protein n=1 Tax=Fodinibius sp. TaxID=1872440 RepID=UPI002ACDC351|nr:TonB family protein [Fodinibius sp.]MDZ7659894.1 TonB family protein [Fodinibius sp.]
MSHPFSYTFLIGLSILLLSCSTTDKTKSAPEVSKENVKVVTETTPAIIGGFEALYQQLTYPSNRSQQTSSITLQANILVSSDGKVTQVSFDQDKYPKYKQAAREAIYAVKFVPGKRNGEAVDMFITIPIQFNAR